MKKLTTYLLCLLASAGLQAAEADHSLTLDSCRTLAISNNKALRMADMRQRAAYYQRKAAFTNFLPRVSASGAYLHTSRQISLLSDEQKGALNQLGTAIGSLAPSLAGMEESLNSVGHGLVEALHTDTREMGTVAVMLTQPLYMGGKIAAYHRITRYAEQIARQQQDLALQEVVVEVDEAYWQIVALQHKKRLADSYLALVQKLDSDVGQLIAEGMATRADGLSVKVKVNEARMAQIQVDNGLSMARMLLCQLCGLPMDTPVTLADEAPDALDGKDDDLPGKDGSDVQTAWSLRPELRALDLSVRLYQEKVKVTRAEHLPTVALTGGYLASNPSVFNSFERRMKGMWSVGVVVNVPLLTWGERCYKVNAARAEAGLARYQWAETREKVELQVNRQRQKLEEATARLRTARRGLEEADENLHHANEGLKEGVIPLSNVLEAQTAWLSAHSVHVSALIDLRLADLYLRKATGTL